MELTREHLERTRESLLVERDNVSLDVLSFLNSVFYVDRVIDLQRAQ